MNQRPELIDATADERDDAALTETLLDELGAERPDPAEFAAGVRTKIEQPPATARTLPGYLRAAAALLPPFVLPKPLSAGVGSVIAGKGFAKLLPGIAAFPIATIAVLVVTVFVLLRALFRPVAAASPEIDREQIDEELAGWWRQHAVAAAVVLIVLFAMLFFAVVEAVMLVLVVSSFALLAIWGRLAAAGFASREAIGQRAAGILIIVGVNASGIIFQLHSSQAGVLWIPPMTAAAALGCLLLAGTGKKDMRRFLVVAAVVVPITGMGFGMRAFTGKVAVTVDEVRASIEAADGGDRWQSRLEEVARCLRHLRAAGGPLPDLAGLREAVQTFRDEELATMEFDLAALAVIELGFARDSDWRRWQDDYRQRQILARGRVTGSLDHLATCVLDHDGALDGARRDAIAAGIVSGNRARPEFDNLEELVTQIVLLDALGRGGAVAGMRERAERLLRDRWVTTVDGRLGAFAKYRPKVEGAPEGSVDRLSSVWLDSTSCGVQVLARFGVPEGVDLVALGRYLEEERRRHKWSAIDANKADAACALAHLESLPAYRTMLAVDPGRPLLAALLEWRVFGAALLLCGFALAATWRARPAPAAHGSTSA